VNHALRSYRAFASVCLLAAACGGAPDGVVRSGGPETAGPAQPEPPSTAISIEVPRVAPPPKTPSTGTAGDPDATDTPVAGDGWLMFQGNAARTGTTTRPAITRPRILWKASVGVQSWLNTPLVLASSMVVVPSSGNTHNGPDARDGVYGLDLKTGKQIFFVHTDRDANGVAAVGDRVYATADDGNLHAIDTTTGKLLWKRRGGGKMYTNPLAVKAADKTLIVVGDSTGAVRAFDADKGGELWKVQLDGAVRGGVASDGVSLFAASQKGDVIALTPNGKTVWKIRGTRPPYGSGPVVPIEVYATPVVAQGLVIVPFARDTYYDMPALIAYEVSTGKERWRAKGGEGKFGNLRSSPAVAGDKLVFSEPYSGDIAAVRIADGGLAYRTTLGPCYFPQWASPVIAGTTAYVPRFDGSIYAVQAATGKSLWELYIGNATNAGRGASPGGAAACNWEVAGGSSIYASLALASDGTIIAGTGEGFVYAIGKQ
jgi:outer membrane protein assembly factor BamB